MAQKSAQKSLPPLTRTADERAVRLLHASSQVEDNAALPTSEVAAWLADRRAARTFEVTPIPLRHLVGWHSDPATGDLVHDTGRFFTVHGLQVSTTFGDVPRWSQPIIGQPEVGVLGILMQRREGMFRFLLQAKIEPGNVNAVQLSPTVQATQSNSMRVHGGARTTYLEYFTGRRRGRVIVDSLQPEHGARFVGKRNRNMVVEVDDDVPPHPDFCWLTLGQMHALLRRDNVVNMDTRTVLSCLPATYETGTPRRGDPAAGLGAAEALSWITELRGRFRRSIRRIPLDDVVGWTRGDYTISHERHVFFSVIAVDVVADSREVTRWTQPMLRPCHQGLVAVLVRRVGGALDVLMQAKVEAGNRGVVELSPTVHCTPANYRDLPEERWPAYLPQVLRAPRADLLFDVMLSEEGGRFFQEQNRHLVLDVTACPPPVVSDRFRWTRRDELSRIVADTDLLSIQARSMLACLSTLS